MARFRKPLIPFIFRFSVVHTVTYLIFGVSFMLISDYFTAFTEDPLMNAVMKPADSLSVQLAVPMQLLRGALLALAIYPFKSVIFKSKYGWLKLFVLLYVLTSLGAVITGPGSIEGFIYTNFTYNLLFGVPEITLQMLAFSWLFCKWQARSEMRVNKLVGVSDAKAV